ncbi:MAG TPA: AMP-binding protein [Blastocatellia bacterium]|nr:AMP-binding protein [Blastocatellia bacterium]
MNGSQFYNRELETMRRERLRQWQSERLRLLMAELATNEFYQAKARAAGVELARIEQPEDLDALPFTTKAELVEEQTARPPFGRLLTYPLTRYRYLHQTSGTTGRPLRWLDTEESWDWWTRCWGMVYRGAGVTAGDVVFCAFSFGPFISHWTAIAGAWHVGAMAVAGGGMNSEQRLHALIDNRCTVLISTPTYALHLAEVANRQGINLRASMIRRMIHAGEPGASLPAVKQAIETAWGATCFDHAGATEVGAWAFDCQAQSGAIHLNEAEFIFDLIDPANGAAVAEGERGELVITNLGRGGMPVLRYRTGDLVELTHEPCACGRGFARIRGGVLGRADDMLIVRGVNLYPSAIDNLIRGLPEVIEYEVRVHRVAGMDDLLIRLETADAAPFAETARALLARFRRQFGIRISLEQAAPNSLPRYEFKARRFNRA